MLPRLAIVLKAGFEFTFPGWNYKTTEVSECRTLNHIWNVIFMAWGIKDGELFCWSIKLCSSYFYCLTFGFLFFGLVHHISQPPGVTSFVLCFLFILLNSSIIYNAHLVNHLATDCWLASVDVADKDNWARLFLCIYLNNVVSSSHLYIVDLFGLWRLIRLSLFGTSRLLTWLVHILLWCIFSSFILILLFIRHSICCIILLTIINFELVYIFIFVLSVTWLFVSFLLQFFIFFCFGREVKLVNFGYHHRKLRAGGIMFVNE